MQTDGLIFDLDGTLWDACPIVAEVWGRHLTRVGLADRFKVDADALRRICGKTPEQFYGELFPGLSREEALRIIAEAQEAEAESLIRTTGELYPGVAHSIPRLANRTFIGLVSNCEVGYLDAFLNFSLIGRYFADAECHGRAGLSKAENIRLVIERNRLRRPVYVGDTEGDRLAAETAGAAFIFARYGFGSITVDAPAIDSIEELEGLLSFAGHRPQP